jgi:hypothetical protein
MFLSQMEQKKVFKVTVRVKAVGEIALMQAVLLS